MSDSCSKCKVKLELSQVTDATILGKCPKCGVVWVWFTNDRKATRET